MKAINFYCINPLLYLGVRLGFTDIFTQNRNSERRKNYEKNAADVFSFVESNTCSITRDTNY